MQIANKYSEGNFTIVPNELINFNELSLEAKGLLVYLISKPEDFKIKVKLLPNLLGISEPKLRRIWKEVSEKGFIESTKEFSSGCVIKWSHKVVLPEKLRLEQTDHKRFFHTRKIELENTCVEKPLVYNNTISNKTLNKKELNISAESEDSDFERFWNIYDKKIEHKKCLVKWRNITKRNKEKIFQTLEAYVKSRPDKQYRKNPLTYLNGECWNDEIQIYQDFNSPNNQVLSSAPSARQTIDIPDNF